MLDRERGDLVARAAVGIEEEVEQGVRIPFGKGFAGKVAADRAPVFLPDVDHADVLNPILRQKGIKSLLGVPLLVAGEPIGVLHVGTLRPRVFTATTSSSCSSSPRGSHWRSSARRSTKSSYCSTSSS